MHHRATVNNSHGITRGAREQLAIEFDREYDRRSLGSRQRTPGAQRRLDEQAWWLRPGRESVAEHERLAEMLVEIPLPTLAMVFETLRDHDLRFSELQGHVGVAEAAIISNRLGLSGLAVLDGDCFVITERGRRMLDLIHGV